VNLNQTNCQGSGMQVSDCDWLHVLLFVIFYMNYLLLMHMSINVIYFVIGGINAYAIYALRIVYCVSLTHVLHLFVQHYASYISQSVMYLYFILQVNSESCEIQQLNW
jgi:hypothetical protein